MWNSKYFEIFFTTDFVTEESWLNFLSYVSKLNGFFRSYKVYINFEKNNVRYFIKTKQEMPTTLGNLNDFLLKKINNIEIPNSFFRPKLLYLVTNKEKSVVDILDRNESKKKRKLEWAEVKITPYKKDNYIFSSLGIFRKNNRLIYKKFLFNIPHIFLSIDFSKHTRFLHRKDIKRYLDIEKTIKVFESDNKNSILKIDAFPYLQDDYYLNLNSYDFDKHSIVIGGSGTGKSKLLSLLVNNIYNNLNYKLKYKIVVIDPHSSLEEDIGGLKNTKVIDFKNERDSIDLFQTSRKNIVSETEILLSLFKSIMDKDYNSKLERVLRHSIFLLISIDKMNFINLRELIINSEFRNQILKKYNEILPEPIENFFLNDFNELKNKSHTEAISPIISFIDEMTILPAFSSKNKLENLEKTIQNNFLSIISLDESSVGEKMTKTISGLIMGQIFSIMQKRSIEEHIILIVDEVAIIQNPILKRFLSESRKYNLSLILSGQYFNQISEDIQKAIFANVINYYTFRVSREDAIILSRNMQMEVAVHDSFFSKLKILSELGNRECVLRISMNGRVLPAFRARTLDVISHPRIVEKEEKIEVIKKETKQNFKSKFLINNNISLKEIMKSQSTGRRKLVSD